MMIRLSPDVAEALLKLKEYELEPINDVLRRLIGKGKKREREQKEQKPKKTQPVDTASELWMAWADAYRQRYGVDYPRNAKVNAQLKRIKERIGQDAVEVIRFYLLSNDAWLLKTKHAIGNLAKNPETWLVRWQTGQHTISDRLAREAEKAATADDEMRVAMEKVERIFSFMDKGGNK